MVTADHRRTPEHPRDHPLMDLMNKTPFAAERVIHQDNMGRDVLVVIVKATYTLRPPSLLAPADLQVPIQHADDFLGEPDGSSVQQESDLAPYKPGTDLVVRGHAYAPRGRATEVHVSLRVGPIHQVLAVFGDRRHRAMLGISSPKVFEKIPLVYERAFGGRDTSSPDAAHHEVEARNPVGRGFRAKRSRLDVDEMLLPNIEDPNHLIRSPDDRPEPVGFGFINRHWEPRRAYAGTLDEAWFTTRSPLPPKDFDDRYHNGAHPRLVATPHLLGDEQVELANAAAWGVLRFRLPGVRPKVEVRVGKARHALDLAFDTLVIEPDEDRVLMVWRGCRPMGNDMYRTKKIEITCPPPWA